MSKNKLSRCFWLQAKLVLDSPVLTGSGKAENSDSDLLLDAEGKPFVPGSSMAGVVRSGIRSSESLTEAQLAALYGDDIAQHRQSMITFYDSFPAEGSEADIVVRDGIELNEAAKTAKNKSKYNYEVLNPGAKFDFKIEILLREQFKTLPVIQFLRELKGFADSGDMRLGAKTARGFGRVHLEDICCRELVIQTPADMENYVNFSWDKVAQCGNAVDLSETAYRTPYTEIEVPLEVESTLLIRTYFLNNFDVDCEQMTVNGRAVVPGTAWAGLMRHRAADMLAEMSCPAEKRKKLICGLFGAEKDSADISSSRIIFEETADEAPRLPEPEQWKQFRDITRNKIDRFTGGVLETGLFSERVAVGGRYTLRMRIKNASDGETGLMLLAAEDICHGLAAVGGATAVGRGTMKARGAVRVNGSEVQAAEKAGYWAALAQMLCAEVEA